MANIAISNICNLSCPYCFAAMHMNAARKDLAPAFIPLPLFEQRLDFLDRSGVDQVRLIGGEPTLHPDFPQIIERIKERGKHIVIFSHGLIPQPVLSCLAALPEDACTVLVNMNATRYEAGPVKRELDQRLHALRRLNQRVILGFTIYQINFSLDGLLPIIDATGSQRVIRLGLAQPILKGENRYLHPKQYVLAGSKIVSFALLAAKQYVRLEFDCGFVRCMFSAEDMRALQEVGTEVVYRCSPILDIDIAGTAVHCFPLTGVIQTNSDNGLQADQLRENLTRDTSAYRTAGIYRECSTCAYKANGSCTGGCLAATMRRFSHYPFSIRLHDPDGQG